MANAVISFSNPNLLVPKNNDAIINFSITPPLFTSENTLFSIMTIQDLGSGKMFTAPIDLSLWTSVSKIEVI